MQTLSQAASAAYYLGHCESHRSPLHYYSGGDEPDGVWWNPSGLLGLEDGATIDADDFQSLYAGLSPDDQTPLSRNATFKNRSPGLDLTFSADKTISALWALADPQLREQIEACHRDAVRWTLETITHKHCAYTRRGQGGKEVLSGDILGVTFDHHTSRDNDPQLHTHCVIFNLVRTHDDGVWRSHHQRTAYQWVRAGGAVYRHALAWNLQKRLQLQLERYGHDDEFVRLSGIPGDLIEAWSTRRKSIEIAARKLGINTAQSAALTQQIALGTRPRKDTADPADRDARFHQEAELYVDPRALIEELLSAGITRPDEAQVRAALDRCRQIPARLTIGEAVFTIPKLVEHIARESPGLVNPAGLRTMLARLLKDRSVIALDQQRKGSAADARAGLAHTRLYSTLDYATEERSVQQHASRSLFTSGHAIPREAVQRRLDALMRDGYVIGAQQGEAVHHLAGADTSIAVCLGAAGSGKTVALRPVADLYRERGYRVIATAFSWRASLNLANETGAQPHSLARLFTQVHAGHTVLDDKTLLIVDEAGTLSVREMRTVLEIAERAGAKVLLVGDLDQLQPIEAGPGLRLVVDQVGAAKIETIRRQRPDLEDLAAWWFGETAQAARGRVELMSEAQHNELQSHRGDYPGQGWQAQTSEAIRKGNASAAIDAYAERGRLHLESTHEHALAHLAQDWIAFRKHNPTASCLVIARTNREVRKLSELLRAVALPSGIDRPHVTISVSNGDPGRKQTKDLEIAQGDLLRICTTVMKHQLFNGSIVTVNEVRTVIEAGRERVLINATTEHHKDVTFYADEVRDLYGNIRLDHGNPCSTPRSIRTSCAASSTSPPKPHNAQAPPTSSASRSRRRPVTPPTTSHAITSPASTICAPTISTRRPATCPPTSTPAPSDGPSPPTPCTASSTISAPSPRRSAPARSSSMPTPTATRALASSKPSTTSSRASAPSSHPRNRSSSLSSPGSTPPPNPSSPISPNTSASSPAQRSSPPTKSRAPPSARSKTISTATNPPAPPGSSAPRSRPSSRVRSASTPRRRKFTSRPNGSRPTSSKPISRPARSASTPAPAAAKPRRESAHSAASTTVACSAKTPPRVHSLRSAQVPPHPTATRKGHVVVSRFLSLSRHDFRPGCSVDAFPGMNSGSSQGLFVELLQGPETPRFRLQRIVFAIL